MLNQLCSKPQLLLVGLILMVGCRSESAAPTLVPSVGSGRSGPSLPIHEKINLGVLYQGETIRMKSWAWNRSEQPIRIAKIETSCECLEAELLQWEIRPGERCLVSLKYDTAKEPEFVGSLLIEITLQDEQGTSLGRIDVPVEVLANPTRE